MNVFTVFKALGPIDARNLHRDSMLRWMLFGPLAIAIIFRYLWPWATTQVQGQFGLDLRAYYLLLYGFLVLMCPVMYGIVGGFLLLDERDDRTLTALQVTPLPLTHYAAYRMSTPALIGILITPLALWIIGVHDLSLPEMVLVALVAAPLAPLTMFFLAVYAANKVQGLALVKASGFVLMVPLVAWFVSMPWQLAFGLAPTYWPVKVYWALAAGEPDTWFYVLVGIGLQLVLLYGLRRRFKKVMYR